MANYVPRLVDGQLAAMLDELPAIALNGPKAVGKTASAQRVSSSFVRLDHLPEQELFQADPDRIRRLPSPVLLDEWQRTPQAWDEVRRWVDDGAPSGSVILTGSAAPRGSAIHSGAGRIATLRMRPLSLAERNDRPTAISLDGLLRQEQRTVDATTTADLAHYVREITASGFPGIRSLSSQGRIRQLNAYIDHVIQHDFPEQGLAVRAPETLRRWLRAYAAASGTATSYAKILDAATPAVTNKPAKSTTKTYTSHLGARLGHLRTRNGDHEVDFIVQRGRRTVAIEVKLSASVTDEDVRHLSWLKARMGPHLTDAAIVTTGTTAYRRKDGIAVIPAALLGP